MPAARTPAGFGLRAVRLAGAGAGAGLLLAALDIGRVWIGHGPALSLGNDAVVVTLGVVGALTVTTTAFALALGAWVAIANAVGRRLPAPRAMAALGGAVPVAAAVALLNGVVLEKAAPAWAVLVALALGGGALFLAVRAPATGSSPGWARGASGALALVLAVGLTHADATLYVNLYPNQHRTLALLAAVAAIAFASGLPGTAPDAPARGRPVPAVALLALAGLAGAALFAFAPADVTQNARYLTRQAAPLTSHALALLGTLSDWDRDGVPALLGAGDCDNGDPAVHPGAREVPDNGVDDDCLGGDLDEAARAAWRMRFAPPTSPGPAPPPLRHLVFVSIDALRWDRFAAPQEGGRDLTPNLRRLANEGALFRRMYAPYPSTILSLYGILTSRYPSQIQLAPYHQFQVPAADPSPTLAELLGREGFRSGGFWFHHIFAPALGIGRGFQTTWTEGSSDEVVNRTISGAEAVDRGLAWVDALRASAPDARLFLWVHLYDPHEPYLPHPEYDFGDDDAARYDAEVAWSDAQLGRLVEGLAARGVLDEAALWFFADHGEELGEHGGRYHATSLYEELVHVPAVLRLPGRAASVVDRPLSLLDVAPTSLALLGLGDRAPPSFQGRSLVPLLQGAQPAPRPVFVECFRKDGAVLRGVVEGPWKLVHWRDDQFFELYHLEKDPEERLNVFDLLPQQGEALARLLGAWVALALDADPEDAISPADLGPPGPAR